MTTLHLKPGKETIIRHGHPWIFSGALAGRPRAEAGEIVRVQSASGGFLGYGFYHPETDIAVRMLSRNEATVFDEAWWRSRFEAAIRLRQWVIPENTTGFRLINAEGDGFPGLIVDKYGPVLVVSITTAGIERLRDLFIGLLTGLTEPEIVYERSEGRSRHLEGLENRLGAFGTPPSVPAVEILENGHKFLVDPVNGQKTGFFLDQRNNRRLIGSLAKGKRVLNCFSYTGGFSVYAAAAGCTCVISVDSSTDANEQAKEHLTLNGLSETDHPVINANAFDYLRASDDLFDIVILDPPAFAKSPGDVQRAARGYKDINLSAIKRLKPGGLLVTFSCSNFVTMDLFQKIVSGAAQDAGRTPALLTTLGPGEDHPTILAHHEGRYLKGLLLRVS